MKALVYVVTYLFSSVSLLAGLITGTLGFESDPSGSPPLGAIMSEKGCAFVTDRNAFSGKQCLQITADANPVRVEWTDSFYPNLFWWFRQPADIRISCSLSAAAGQKNKDLCLLLGTQGTRSAVVLRFGSDGNITALTADGERIIAAYNKDFWYRFEVNTKTMTPLFDLIVRDRNGVEIGHAKNLKWNDPGLTEGLLTGFGFTVQRGGTLFVDDLVFQEIDPVEKLKWPRQLVNYPMTNE